MKDKDWFGFILWTIICIAFGMIIGMFVNDLIYYRLKL
jgi:uncharacterized protein YneF (UPF0154 family)